MLRPRPASAFISADIPLVEQNSKGFCNVAQRLLHVSYLQQVKAIISAGLSHNYHYYPVCWASQWHMIMMEIRHRSLFLLYSHNWITLGVTVNYRQEYYTFHFVVEQNNANSVFVYIMITQVLFINLTSTVILIIISLIITWPKLNNVV